jgi:nitroreductase
MDEGFGLGSAWDVGMYAQTLMLAMTANGLASCAQGTMGHHPDLVREAFGLGDEVKVLFGISFGYEDTSMKVNEAHTERALLEDTVTFKS